MAPTIFSDFLSALRVRHTREYSDNSFRTMPFSTLFGFARLLGQYGIPTQCLRLSDKSQLTKLPLPFIAKEGAGFVIVTALHRKEKGTQTVDYEFYHERKTVSLAEFEDKWDGTVLLAFPTADSVEPEYKKHRFYEIAGYVKLWLLIAAAVFIGVYGFVESGLWRNISTCLLTAINLVGLYVCWLLLLKSLKVKSKAADRFCGVLQEHGCDTVLEQKASTFFGLFSWSEVGLAYFSVTTLVTFIFPHLLPRLALINGCCLPFTVWSISYQKFAIKTWCTLCVTVQTLLWLQFFCYLAGGWWHGAFPLRLPIFVLGAAYMAVMFSLNRIVTFILNYKKS